MSIYNIALQQYVQHLPTIPNILGFKFSGVTWEDSVIACNVALTPKGVYFVADSYGNPVYSKLKDWFL